MGCILLRSGAAGGEVVATDGRQILIRGGFAFPWDGDALIHRVPICAGRDLPRDRPWAIGRTASHVVLRSESLRLACAIQADARFPQIDQIFPDPTANAARLRIDPAYVAFLVESLGRLLGFESPHAPVTVDLNGHLTVRVAGGTGTAATTELVLSRSRSTGTSVRFGTDRTLLACGLRFGFAEVEVVDFKSPIVCRSDLSAFGWQLLNPESVVEPTANVTRIASPLEPAVAPARSPEPASRTRRPTPPSNPPRPAHPSPAVVPDFDPTATGLAGMIREAEAPHAALGATRTRSRLVIVALKRHRKLARLTAATLATLRQLKLRDVAG